MYPTLTNYNITGPHILVCYANDVTSGIFMDFLLLVIFMVMLGSIMYFQKRSSGTSSFPVAFSVAAWTICVFSIVMRLISCPAAPMISDRALVMSIVTSVIGVFLLYSHK